MPNAGPQPVESPATAQPPAALAALWQAVLTELRRDPSISAAGFQGWLATASLVGQDDDLFVIAGATTYHQGMLERNFRRPILAALQQLVGRAVRAKFVVASTRGPARPAAVETQAHDAGGTPSLGSRSGSLSRSRSHGAKGKTSLASWLPTTPTATAPESEAGSSVSAASAPLPLPRLDASPRSEGTTLHSRYTFTNFIVGKHNQFAAAAARAVADRPASAYNPLFIYGGVGLGKTHLLHAVGHHVLHAQPGAQVLYVTSEQFTNDFINHLQRGRIDAFRNKYRTTDVLLIDDIQFLAGKEQTQEEFFHTFNALYGDSKQLILSSDRPPAAIAALEDRLRSRFAMGLIADIQPPDFETRVAILQAKAALMGAAVPQPVLAFIARRVQSNVRELEGALTRAVATANLSHVPLTVENVAAALTGVLFNTPQRTATPDQILLVVSNYCGVPLEALRGKQRDKPIVVPRQIAMYLMREETEASLVEIGQHLGGRDHSTVLHGCEKITRELPANAKLREQVQAIRALLAGLADGR